VYSWATSEGEVAIWKLKRYKSPGVDQIPAELIQAGGETLRSEIHKLIKLIWNKEELPHQWRVSYGTYQHMGDKTDCGNCQGISLLSTSYKMLSHILVSTQMKLLGITNVDFDVIDQRLIKLSTAGRYWEKMGV
jgi:hypothetical protein